MVKIITEYGFCFGVENAIQILKQASISHPGEKIFLRHPLLHNLPENERLMKKAHARFLNPEEEAEKSSLLVLSAHGHPLEEEKDFPGTILDATCPLIQKRYALLEKIDPNTTYLFLGKKNHEETKGFLSHFPFLILLDSEQDLLPQIETITLKKKAYLVPQTTISEAKRKKAVELLASRCDSVFSLPICPLYSKRAKEALDFLKDKDPFSSYFVVVGDTSSSNAKEILSSVLSSIPHLEGQIALSIQDIPLAKRKGKDIYLASATSVSKETVEELFATLSSEDSL